MEWDPAERTVHLGRTHALFTEYSARHGVTAGTQAAITEVLLSPTVAFLLELPEHDWSSVLVNDLYKAGMHKCYAAFFSGVSADFALSVRRTPVTLARMARQRPQLFQALQERVSQLQGVQPYSPEVLRALQHYAPNFTCSQAMQDRAQAHGVAPVTWQAGQLPNGQESDVCIAAGPIESASHAETTVLQLVQAAIIRFQVEELREQQQQQQQQQPQGVSGGGGGGVGDVSGGSGTTAAAADNSGGCSGITSSSSSSEGEHGWWLDRSELLANSLAHLALVVERLNSRDHGFQLALFAGRRSSDRLYLILQTLVFSKLVKGYVGTSSLYVATLLDKAWDNLGMLLSERRAHMGRLVGTHAHEQSMLAQQLLSHFDGEAGRVARKRGEGPVNVTALVAHLLFLAANGDLGAATALPDTFGTAAFVAVAALAHIPPSFASHMEKMHGERVPEGATCFDLFRVWRIDSGDYEASARLVLAAWESRSHQRTNQGLPCLPRPHFIHSDLKNVDQIMKFADLPPGLKPTTLAFGSLADGFLPFPKSCSDADQRLPTEGTPPQHQNVRSVPAPEVGIGMASIVMKAVQGYVCGQRSLQASAMKLGDDPEEKKLILDPRLSPSDKTPLVEMAHCMARVRSDELDGPALSQVLARAYEEATHKFREKECM